jgi:hypothetical protein
VSVTRVGRTLTLRRSYARPAFDTSNKITISPLDRSFWDFVSFFLEILLTGVKTQLWSKKFTQIASFPIKPNSRRNDYHSQSKPINENPHTNGNIFHNGWIDMHLFILMLIALSAIMVRSSEARSIEC